MTAVRRHRLQVVSYGSRLLPSLVAAGHWESQRTLAGRGIGNRSTRRRVRGVPLLITLGLRGGWRLTDRKSVLLSHG